MKSQPTSNNIDSKLMAKAKGAEEAEPSTREKRALSLDQDPQELTKFHKSEAESEFATREGVTSVEQLRVPLWTFGMTPDGKLLGPMSNPMFLYKAHGYSVDSSEVLVNDEEAALVKSINDLKQEYLGNEEAYTRISNLLRKNPNNKLKLLIEQWKDIAAEAMAGEDDPSSLCCPLTGELIKYPVVAGDGDLYERRSLQEMIKAKLRFNDELTAAQTRKKFEYSNIVDSAHDRAAIHWYLSLKEGIEVRNPLYLYEAQDERVLFRLAGINLETNLPIKLAYDSKKNYVTFKFADLSKEFHTKILCFLKSLDPELVVDDKYDDSSSIHGEAQISFGRGYYKKKNPELDASIEENWKLCFVPKTFDLRLKREQYEGFVKYFNSFQSESGIIDSNYTPASYSCITMNADWSRFSQLLNSIRYYKAAEEFANASMIIFYPSVYTISELPFPFKYDVKSNHATYNLEFSTKVKFDNLLTYLENHSWLPGGLVENSSYDDATNRGEITINAKILCTRKYVTCLKDMRNVIESVVVNPSSSKEKDIWSNGEFQKFLLRKTQVVRKQRNTQMYVLPNFQLVMFLSFNNFENYNFFLEHVAENYDDCIISHTILSNQRSNLLVKFALDMGKLFAAGVIKNIRKDWNYFPVATELSQYSAKVYRSIFSFTNRVLGNTSTELSETLGEGIG